MSVYIKYIYSSPLPKLQRHPDEALPPPHDDGVDPWDGRQGLSSAPYNDHHCVSCPVLRQQVLKAGLAHWKDTCVEETGVQS